MILKDARRFDEIVRENEKLKKIIVELKRQIEKDKEILKQIKEIADGV